MPAWAGTLSFRHRRLFLGLADLWRPSRPHGAAGGLATTYLLALTSVPYVLDRKSAIETPYVVGALEGEEIINTDTARFPPGTEMHSSWIIVDRSLTRLGVPGLNFGGAWALKGDPVMDDELDNVRRAGAVEAYVTRLMEVPAVISEYYS